MYSTRSKGALQPLFAAALAAHTPPDIELKLYDERIEEIPYDESTDLVALTIETFCAKQAYRIATEYRKRGIRVVAGGYHATLCPEECLNHVDAILCGDAEELWPVVLADFQKGQLKKRYVQNGMVDPSRINFRKDIFKGKPYGPIELVQFGRGCPYDCDFCSIKSFYGSGQICRPIETLIEELETLDSKTVFFIDDNLLHNRKAFKEFLRKITPLKLKWVCQISITVARDDELLRLMADSGCFVVLIGFESFSEANLKLMNKQWNTASLSYDEAVRKIMSHGIFIYGTFIFGYDHDTPDAFRMAIDFAMKHRFFIANFNPLYPMPGSGLYERLKKESRLIENWWIEDRFYYGKSMLKPSLMTSEELETKCYQAKMEFNSWRSILQRSPVAMRSNHILHNLALFFYTNYINRHEIIHKQGKYFGA